MPARSRRFLTTPRHEHAGDYSGGELQLVLRSGAVPAFPACACGPQLRRPQPCRSQPASRAPTFAGARRPRLRGGRGLLPGCLFAPSRAPPAHRHPPQPRLVGQRQGTQPPDLKGGPIVVSVFRHQGSYLSSFSLHSNSMPHAITRDSQESRRDGTYVHGHSSSARCVGTLGGVSAVNA